MQTNILRIYLGTWHHLCIVTATMTS